MVLDVIVGVLAVGNVFRRQIGDFSKRVFKSFGGLLLVFLKCWDRSLERCNLSSVVPAPFSHPCFSWRHQSPLMQRYDAPELLLVFEWPSAAFIEFDQPLPLRLKPAPRQALSKACGLSRMKRMSCIVQIHDRHGRAYPGHPRLRLFEV